METKSRAKELMGYSFLVLFANDSTIDEDELMMLEKLALEDHQVDEEEKEVLRNIFSRVTRDDVVEKVWVEIERFRKRYEV